MGFGWVIHGIRRLAERLQRAAQMRGWPQLPWATSLAGVAGLVVFLPPLMSIHSFYPHLLSYYSENVGGLPTATRLGLETTYWCETFAAALPYLNKNARPGDVVWVEPWSFDIMIYYQLHGRLRPDLHITFPPYDYANSVFQGVPINRSRLSYDSADYVVFQYRQSYYGRLTDPAPLPPEWLNSRQPVLRLSLQGIPLMEVYANNRE
jgi:hypothetical protein